MAASSISFLFDDARKAAIDRDRKAAILENVRKECYQKHITDNREAYEARVAAVIAELKDERLVCINYEIHECGKKFIPGEYPTPREIVDDALTEFGTIVHVASPRSAGAGGAEYLSCSDIAMKMNTSSRSYWALGLFVFSCGSTTSYTGRSNCEGVTRSRSFRLLTDAEIEEVETIATRVLNKTEGNAEGTA